jgi:hypothetical protein
MTRSNSLSIKTTSIAATSPFKKANRLPGASPRQMSKNLSDGQQARVDLLKSTINHHGDRVHNTTLAEGIINELGSVISDKTPSNQERNAVIREIQSQNYRTGAGSKANTSDSLKEGENELIQSIRSFLLGH